MRIDIVGAGRLGRSLAILWRRRGHDVRLRRRHDRPAVDAAAIFLCVPDDQIAEVAATLDTHVPTFHCSGATDLSPLAHLPEHGSLHPLMTFPGPEIALPKLEGVAAAVDGTPAARELAARLAHDLGMAPVEVSGDRRLYHAAAVLAGNFATVLIAEAARALVAAGVAPDEAAGLVVPLATASLQNAAPDPAAALTGPAARGDLEVLASHRIALGDAGLSDLRELYDVLAARALRLGAESRANQDVKPPQRLSMPVVVVDDGV